MLATEQRAICIDCRALDCSNIRNTTRTMITPYSIRRLLFLTFTACIAITTVACAPQRRRVLPGVVPTPRAASAEDERYGHEVLNTLVEKFSLSRDDKFIHRVRDIVDQLTAGPRFDSVSWHVHVLEDPNFKNAAATRGNYIIVWTGINSLVRTDAELATVIAHEIGHVLAGHPLADPGEEANKILSGVAGAATRGILQSQGAAGIAAQLAGALVQSTFEGLIVNPHTQELELEADHIGLFLMAESGYPPSSALDFWERASRDKDFSGGPEFFSSHPSAENRVKSLRTLLPLAEQRYRPRQN
jgi:metalloendopeptidase OMA1, mitochondrial